MNRNRLSHLKPSLYARTRRTTWNGAAVLVCALVWAYSAMAVEDPNEPIQPNETQPAANQELLVANIKNALKGRKKGHPKLESVLYELDAATVGQGLQAAQALGQQRGISDVRGQVEVIVEMEPEPADLALFQAADGTPRSDETESFRRRRGLLKQRLQAGGHAPEAEYRHLLRVRASPGRLVQLAETPGVRFVRLPHRPIPLAVTSEGVALTGAAANYHANGFTGTGVTVAVIDMGFVGLQSAINSGELPSTVIKRDCTLGTSCPAVSVASMETGSVHGTAVAEIVRDMAPGATLILLKAADEVGLGNAKIFAIANGATAIIHSVAWPNTSFTDNTGPITAIANSARASGVHWVNSVGNFGDGFHWHGTFSDPDADGLHNFSGSDFTNGFFAPAGATLYFYLTWNAWPATNQDYDFGIVDSALNLLTGSAELQTGTQPPTEAFAFIVPATGTYSVVIAKDSGSGNATFELFVAPSATGPFLDYASADHSLMPPADATGAIAVGAIDKGLWTGNQQEAYSSQGPTNDGRTKPDIMGPDKTASFSYGVGGFAGTSAAAPHVAGALALLKQANPSFTPSQLENLLYNNAVDLGTGGFDNIFGRGRMRLPGVSVLGVSVSPASWAVGAIPPGTRVQMSEANDLTVTNAGNVAETMTLRIQNPGTAWVPGLGAGTESFQLQGLFVGSADAPGAIDFQSEDTLFSGAPVGATATTFGMASNAPGFNPDAGNALATNLVGYWKLDEASGTREDAIGANDLTDGASVGRASGIVGSAADFVPGDSDTLSCADNPNVSVGDIDYSFAGWVYMDDMASFRFPLTKGNGTNYSYRLSVRPDNKRFEWSVYNGTTGVVGEVQSSTFGALTAGVWVFVYVYHSATGNEVGISVNNGAVDRSATTGAAGDADNPMYFGSDHGTAYFQDGRMDEWGFWKRVLTAQERADLYHGGLGNTLNVNSAGAGGAGVPAAATRDLWLSFTGPTQTTQKNQESIVVEVGAVQSP